MEKKSFTKNIIFLFLLSFAVTSLSTAYIVYYDYNSLKNSTDSKIAAIENTLVENIKIKNYVRLQSLLYVVSDERFESVHLSLDKDEIVIGKIYPRKLSRNLFVRHSVRNFGEQVANVNVVANWEKIAFFSIRRVLPMAIVLNILVIIIAFFAQLPHLLRSQRLADLLKLLGEYDGTDEKKINLTANLQKWGDQTVQNIVLSIANVVEKEREILDKEQQNTHLISIGQSTAMVAHDVRKPLASMKALLSSLPMIKDNPAELKKMIASVDRNITHTNTMLNEILDFSRDSTALELKSLDPQGIITSALGDALRNHPDAAVDIIYDFKHKYCMHVDGTRTIRILTNILDNALDAMKREIGKLFGQIKIGSYETDKEGKKFIGITIADEGPGIPEQTLSRIFDPFFTQGKKGGTGLGLAICHKVVSMHGGSIEAKNRTDTVGAEFVIELPAGKERAYVEENELIHNSKELRVFREEEIERIDYGDTASTAEFMRLHKGRGRESYLLIVDDEPLFRETVHSLLNSISQVKDHVKVVECGSAEEALNLFNARKFDYVIADIDLGHNRMNGYEFVQMILEKYPNTYALIHSNKRKAELDHAIRKKANRDQSKFMGFLPKPMKSSELLQFLACKTFEAPAGKLEEIKSAPKKNVLIVNDDHDLCVALRFMLKSPTVQVLTAANVSSALTYLAERKVDVILSDINLGEGDIDGYELLRKVREKDKDTPFYMISGFTQSDEEPKAKKLGANGYLQLPVSKEQLQELVQ